MLVEGEQYGYRQGAKGDFVPVEFIRQGRGRQAKKVLVRFLEEDQDGAEEWVPPGRLQVPWADVDERRQEEANRTRLQASSARVSEGVRMAVAWATEIGLEADVMDSDGREGVSKIYDVAAVERAIGGTLIEGEDAYWSKGTYFVPTSVTLSIAATLAARNSDAVLRHVDQEEAMWRENEVRDYVLRNGRPKHPQSFQDEEDTLASWRYLREWAGGDEPEQWQALTDTRVELAKVRQLLALAIEKLEKYGHVASAETMRGYMNGKPLPSNLKKDWRR